MRRGDLAGAVEIPGLDEGGEAIGRAVGDRDRLVLVAVADDRQDRPEDLLAGDGHPGLDIGEHGRPDIVAAVEAFRPAEPAGDEPRALGDARLDEALNLVKWPSLASGPSVVVRSVGLPILNDSAAVLAISAARSWSCAGTSMRVGALQVWPALRKQPATPP